MHDLLEADLEEYDLSLIINHFISKGYFSLAELNLNLTEDITRKHLDNQSFHFLSSEMLCFINFLPLMIGDLIPLDDEVWDFFMGLLKILDIVMDSSLID
jgi:hypothetical protein